MLTEAKVILLWRDYLLHLCSGNEGSDFEPLSPHRSAKGFSTPRLGMHSCGYRYRHRFCNREYFSMRSYSQSLGHKCYWILHRRQRSLLCKRRTRHISRCVYICSPYENAIPTAGSQEAENCAYVGLCRWRVRRYHGHGTTQFLESSAKYARPFL